MMTNDNGKWPLPEGWVWTTLGEVSAINRRDPRLREQQDDLEVTFLPMAAVDEIQGQIADPQIRKLSDVKKGFTPFSEGDVLFAKITPSMENGKAAIARGLKNGIGFGSTEFHVFSPENGVLSEWVFYYVRQVAFREDAKANFSGTAGQLRVRKDFLEPYPIPLPPLPTQHRIVAEIEKQFTRLDAAVAALRRAKANLARYKAAVLKAAVEGRLVAQDPAGEPASALLARILAERRARWEAANPKKQYVEPKRPDVDDLPELPEGWVWARMDALAEIVSGVAKGRKFGDRKTIHLPYLRVANVQQGYLDLSEIKAIEALPDELETYRLEPNDLVMTEGGDWDKLGRSAIWHGQIKDCIHQNHIFRARPYMSLIPTDWLMIASNSEHGRKYFADSSKQTTNLASINLTQLRAFPVPIPPADEIKSIIAELDRRLSIIQTTEQTLDANLTRAERLRQAVLGKAFRGEL